ncbi:MAG TPA: hypothetical protein VGO43_13245 [Pyrinomonadaceae bacterium]|jgi:hypothetical protein|nr:hypothetical protein [Pyrinomonadaceae bacterium]
MKLVIFAFALMLIGGLTIATSAQTNRYHNRNINARERRQQERIANGIENGSLTPGEAARLEKNEAEVRRIEARLRENGVTSSERARLEHRLNELSSQIYRQKHDQQGRRP